ncbi:MAG: triose-phosphate isomerase [Deltaproteobacteria bacterium]|nr:triose-phosphate isomerase [Deltaproteobacteria bacterium]
MSRRPTIVAGNWKMHKTLPEGEAFLQAFLPRLASRKGTGCQVVLAPNFTLLAAMRDPCRAAGVGLAAQNCHPEARGAFTGEVAVGMLAAAGATHVLVGHSERRHLFHEDDDFLRRKVQAVLAGGLTPIFCVGETLEERTAGQATAVVGRQLRAGLRDVASPAGIIIAYEPVWAIGTGKTATTADAQQMHAFIRQILGELLPAGGAGMPVLYGGSVKPGNAAELLAAPEVDGVLVGGASLEPEDFLQIVAAGDRAAAQV